MRSKTKKLIWLAPVMAVFAVAAALAIFAAQPPNGAQADHLALPGAPEDLKVEPADGADGRTSLVLTWTAPANSTVTGYRIDYSMRNVEYQELVANSESTATTYTHTGLKAGTTYVYRVFAINDAGTGPVSETYSNDTTGVSGTPGDVTGLTAARAATTPEKWSQIDLTWNEADGGGTKITGYCIEFRNIAVATPPGWQTDDAGCRAATTPTGSDLTANPGIIVTQGTKTKYEHKTLAAGSRRYYRAYAITSQGVSAMPSTEVSAITAPRENPMPPVTVRAAKNAAGTDVHLFWYSPVHEGGSPITNFRVEVTTNSSDWPEPTDTTAFDGNPVRNAVGTTAAVHAKGVITVPVATAQANDAATQGTHIHGVNSLATDKKLYYRVFTETGTTTDDNMLRSSVSNVATIVVNDGTIPTMPVFDGTGTPATGATGGKGEIALRWSAGVYDPDGDGTSEPYPASGYRIDYALGTETDATNDALKWQPLWGNTGFTSTKFTHDSLKPSTRVWYRVFAIGSAQAISTAAGPQNATTADVGTLDKVRNVRAVADNSTQITVTWDPPTGTTPSDIKRYNVQVKKLGTANPAVTVFEETDSGSVTSYVDKDLSESETWLYRVAVVADGQTTNPVVGDYTEWVLATTPESGKPDMPIGLVAEDARDSNLFGTGDRGVLLIWNMPEGPAGTEVEMYKIERKVMGTDTDFKALDTSDGIRTTYTDSKEPAEGEVRHYRVAAVSKTKLTSDWAEVRFPADLSNTAPWHNIDPVANDMAIGPVSVAAQGDPHTMDVSGHFSDADGDTLTYAATVMPADGSIATADIPADSSMLTITGVAEGSATVTVTASDGMGGTDAMKTIMVTVTPAALTAPSNVMASQDGSTVTITWEGGDNATTYTVVMVSRNADGTLDIVNSVWDAGLDGSPHDVPMRARPSASYIIGVIAGQTKDGVTTWSNWASGSIPYEKP